jgi:hypothetical protein
MTPGDAARVLAACALYDNRTVGHADAAAWYQTIGDLPVDDALEAVARHYRESTERMMPAHVRRIVREIRDERARATPHEARMLPSRFEDDPAREVRASRGAATVREVLAPVVEHLAAKREALPRSAIDELRAITAGPTWTDTEEAATDGR